MKKPYCISFLICLIGSALLLYVSWNYKVGVAHDSNVYLSMTHHILAGKGVSVYLEMFGISSDPIAAWPPVYPALLALLSLLNQNPLQTAWVLNALLFGINIFLAVVIIYKITRNNTLTFWTLALLLLGSQWRSFYLWIVSEPLFLMVVHFSILSLFKYIRTKDDKWLFIAAFITGLLPTIRYIGIGFIPCASLCVLLLLREDFSKRLSRTFTFGIIASIPLGLWLFRNYNRLAWMRPEDASLSSIVFGSLIKNDQIPNAMSLNFHNAANGILSWFHGMTLIPNQVLMIILYCLILVGLVWSFVLIRGDNEFCKRAEMMIILLVYALGYACVLSLSLSFSHFTGGIPDRYLITSYTQLLLFFIILFYTVNRWSLKYLQLTQIRRGAKLLFWIFGLVWMVHFSHETVSWAEKTMNEGTDLTKGGRHRRAERADWFPNEHSIARYYASRVAQTYPKKATISQH